MQKVSRFSVEKFPSLSVEKFRRGTRLCFRKFRVSKNFMPKRGISRFSTENFSHSTEKFRRGTLLCFTKFLVSKRVMDKRGGGGEEGVSRFSVNFLSHSAEKFRRGTLQCVTNFGYRKILSIRGGYHVSASKTFCHTKPKNFVGEHFRVPENFVYRKILCIRSFMDEKTGGITFFRRNFFVSQRRKTSYRKPLVFH